MHSVGIRENKTSRPPLAEQKPSSSKLRNFSPSAINYKLKLMRAVLTESFSPTSNNEKKY